MTTFGIPPENPTDYVGPKQALTSQVKAARAPATTDKNYPIGCRWWDTVTNNWYWLSHFDAGDAEWVQYTSSPTSGALDTLTTDDATVVIPVMSNINLVGDSSQGVSTSGSGDDATITVQDASTSVKGVAQFSSTYFSATGGVISLLGTAATNTYNADTGSASPSGGALTIAGGTNIATSASGSTVTIAFDGTLPVTSGGTGQTSYNNGELLIGNGTGLSVNTLTEGEGIDIANGSGSITIAGEDATTGVGSGNKGIASFESSDFNATNGHISLSTSFTNKLVPERAKLFYIYHDFYNNWITTIENESTSFGAIGSGTRAIVADEADHLGIRSQSITTTENGVCTTNGNGSYGTINIGQGITTLNLWYRFDSVLTNGKFFFGLSDVSADVFTTQANAVGFVVDDISSSANLVARTTNTSTDTDTDTGVAMNDTSWRKLSIVINAAADEVNFYIDGALEATHTTNIPGTSTGLYCLAKTIDSGNNGWKIYFDFIDLAVEFDGERAT